ncbi:hypothetical protein C7999DRAFT_12118 [Corynascus novoguineensis]|uniref:Uncharacterized protein n=1 Tax=Corynascus novoguineensis TaxID=1126955 RepID=A0AAN7CXN3_9PEZI|nr:hypothetical protein C7999DRAFT_12118 [Corynascus novoguineensis]
MSYRSSDAYSRRPTGDDRRISEFRDRRRESLHKAGSDPHREDRHRRDADTSNRGSLRDPPEEHFRENPSLNNAAKPHLVSSSSENGIQAPPTSQTPAESPSLGITFDKKIDSLLRQHDAAVIEVARLRAERDPLDKIWRQRQEDYEKSKIKHAEFPSVPEVQNLHRVKYAERVRRLDAQIRKAQDIADDTVRSVSSLFSGFSETGVSSQQQEASNTQLAEISEVKSELQRLQAEHAREQSNLKAEFESRFTELKEQLERQHKEQKEKMAEDLKALIETQSMKRCQEEIGNIKQQMRVVREQLDKRNPHSSKALSSAQVSTLIQKETSPLQSDVSELLKRVDDLTRQVSQNAQDTVSFRNEVTERVAQSDQSIAFFRKDLATYTQRVENEAQKVEEHEAKLSSLDTEALEGVAEAMSIEFPDLQRKTAGIQAKLDVAISRQEFESKQEIFFLQVQQFVANSSKTLASMVDDHTVQIEALKKASPKNAASGGAHIEPNQAAKAEFETINSELALIKSDFDAAKVTVDKLSQDISSIVNADLKKQLEAVRFSLNVLDSRYNNLSTKSLAEHIIGQLGQMYPNAHQINADIEALKTMIGNVASRIDELERRIAEYGSGSGGYQAQTCAPEADSLDMPRVSNTRGSMLGDIDDNAQPALKRRRTDLDLNGGEHPPVVTNGTNSR